MRTNRLLTLLALLALVAIPLASGARLCCAMPAATPACCQGAPCDQKPDCAPSLSAWALAPTDAATAPVLGAALAPIAPAAEPAEAAPTPRAPHPDPRPRTPLSEGGACLHTTVLPPPSLHA